MNIEILNKTSKTKKKHLNDEKKDFRKKFNLKVKNKK